MALYTSDIRLLAYIVFGILFIVLAILVFTSDDPTALEELGGFAMLGLVMILALRASMLWTSGLRRSHGRYDGDERVSVWVGKRWGRFKGWYSGDTRRKKERELNKSNEEYARHLQYASAEDPPGKKIESKLN